MPRTCPDCGATFDETDSGVCSACGVAIGEPTVIGEPSPTVDHETETVSPAESSAFDETHVGADPDAPTTGPVGGRGRPAVGATFGDYELIGEIARGGMGVVFRARQTKLNRVVALKMILASHLATDEDVTRFHVEAEAAARLDHPGIVPVYEVGEVDGQHFFSMGLVEGGSLKDLVKEGPLAGKRAAEVVKRIAEAVHYAHTRNIVHRDLKPANVLLDADGQPKVTDFGLAKDIEADTGMTTSGQIMGTPGYMPPEQAAGRTAEIGPLADVYSLGGILYFLLTREPPFRGEGVMETLKKVIDEEPTSPRVRNDTVDVDLATICLKCLEKDPARRYGSAAELAEELGRYVEGRPIEARPVGGAERFRRWCGRNPLVAGLAASAVVLLIAGVCVSTYFAIEANFRAGREAEEKGRAERNFAEAETQRLAAVDARKKAEEQRLAAEAATRVAKAETKRANEEKTRADANATLADENAAAAMEREREATAAKLLAQERARAEAKAKEQLAVALAESERARGESDFVAHAFRVRAAFDAVREGNTDEALGLLRLCKPSLCRWEHDFVFRQSKSDDELEHRTFSGHTGTIGGVALSPDGRRLVSGGWDKTVRVWNADDGAAIHTLTGHPGEVFAVTYAGDGRTFVTAGRNDYNRNDRNDPNWGKDAFVRTWNAETGAAVRTITSATRELMCVAVSHDGRWIAGGSVNGSVIVWDAESGEEVLHLKRVHVGTVRGIAVSPDGRLVVSSGDGNKVIVRNRESGEAVHTLGDFELPVLCLAFAPDGRSFAAGGGGLTPSTQVQKGSVEVRDVETGERLVRMIGHTQPVTGLAYSGDGRRIVTGSADRTVRVWDVATGMQAIALEVPVRVTGVSFSGDNRRITSCDHAGGVHLWDATIGMQAVTLRGHEGEVLALASGPGSMVASVGLDRVVRVWDVDTEETRVLRTNVEGHRGTVILPNSLAVSPDGSRIASVGERIVVWDAETGDELVSIDHQGDLLGVTFSPDGTRIACGGRGARMWDATTGELLREYGVDLRVFYNTAAFGPDGRLLLVAGRRGGGPKGGSRLYDVETGTMIPGFGPTETANGIAFSPDGSRFAVAGGGVNPRIRMKFGQVDVYDARTRRKVGSLTGHTDDTRTVAYSRDGRWIASSGDDGVVKVWDATTLKEVASYAGHDGRVNGLVFTEDGRIVTCGNDRTLRVWVVPSVPVE